MGIKKIVTKKSEKRAVADELPKRPEVSTEAMIEENKATTVSSDYQQYLRKLMKKAGGNA